MGALFETLNLGDAIAHAILNRLFSWINGAIFRAKPCVLDGLSHLLGVFSILRNLSRILILLDHVALCIEPLDLDNFLALPGLLLLLKDLLVCFLFLLSGSCSYYLLLILLLLTFHRLISFHFQSA